MERESDEEHEKLLLDYLAEMDLEATRRYMARGRQLAGASLAVVEEGWLDGLAALADDPGNPARQDRFDDYAAELRLRGVEPPFERGRGSFERLIETNDRALAEMRKEPAREQAVNAALDEDVKRFERERARERVRPN